MEKGIDKNQLVKDILQKKELANLDAEFVKEKLDSFLKQRPNVEKKLAQISTRSKDYKKILKDIRSQLRTVYGVFATSNKDTRSQLLEDLKDLNDPQLIDALLAVHRSSKERLEIYPEVYKNIIAITGKPDSIVDFACGFNPISYPYINAKPKYLACDISTKDLDFIQKFFNKMKINGKTQKVDLLKDDLKKITADYKIAFLFKALDSIESVKRNSSERVLNEIQSKFIVVSFATLSIGGRKPITASRKWFELMSDRLGFIFDKFEFPGEVFYVLRR